MSNVYDTRPDWLQLRVEPSIDPERPICDPHHHLWERPANRYLAEELAADLASGHNIVSTVFVECGAKYHVGETERLQPIGETAFVVAEAQRGATLGCTTNIAAGIASFVDLRLGTDVQNILDAHHAAGQGRFRGIRHCVATHADSRVAPHRIEPPLGLMAERDFREGFACLAPAGVSFEAWLYHPQLPELTDLAKTFPTTNIILNHIGGPLGIGPYENKRAEVFSEWADSITALAKCPNVSVKLGGLGMTLCGFGWEREPLPPSSAMFAETTAPYIHHCINAFGIERSFFESNFPVDKVSCSYHILWNAFKRIAKNYSAAGQDALFHDNAVRVYRLGGKP